MAPRGVLTVIELERWAMILHDLRNPLATVQTYTQLLLRDTALRAPCEPGLAEGLRHIQDAASRLERMVNRLEVTHGTVDVDANSWGHVDLVELTRRLAEEHHSHRVFVLSAEPELGGFWDVVGLERILSNLFDNALKYSPADSSVLVTLWREGGAAVLAVADQGIGIPAADLEKVCKCGFRAPNAARTARGSGIGLAAVRDIVHAHHGKVRVESQEGIGTTVTVILPFRKPTESAAPEPQWEVCRS